MFNIGDRVSVIHDNITGVILSIKAHKALIEDTDGFERHYKVSELVALSKDVYNVDHVAASEFIAAKAIEHPRKVLVQNNKKTKQSVNYMDSYEIDLHIEILYPEATHWATADILQKQMIACRAFIEKAVANKSKKVVLIHGKGEGVLKNEIYRYLNRIEDTFHIGISYSDADFRTYGTGATQVNFNY